jgi:hypothetical protein
MFANLWAKGFSLLGEHLHSSKIGAYGCTVFLLQQLFHTQAKFGSVGYDVMVIGIYHL